MSARHRRMTPLARKGLRAMASYWLTCLELGTDFEDYPTTSEDRVGINAALAYLGLDGIDFEAMDAQMSDD